MISGRGLGYTGGTLDKLESIPGFRVEMNVPFMKRTIQDIGLFIGGQTENIAPVDKKLYSVRDISGTVYSDPLIVCKCDCCLDRRQCNTRGAQGMPSLPRSKLQKNSKEFN